MRKEKVVARKNTAVWKLKCPDEKNDSVQGSIPMTTKKVGTAGIHFSQLMECLSSRTGTCECICITFDRKRKVCEACPIFHHRLAADLEIRISRILGHNQYFSRPLPFQFTSLPVQLYQLTNTWCILLECKWGLCKMAMTWLDVAKSISINA